MKLFYSDIADTCKILYNMLAERSRQSRLICLETLSLEMGIYRLDTGSNIKNRRLLEALHCSNLKTLASKKHLALYRQLS